jgi:hypothetical protein
LLGTKVRIDKVFFSVLSLHAQRKYQRNRAKGVRGCFLDESKAFAEENNAPPWQIPLRGTAKNPLTPMGQNLLTQSIKVLRTGQNCFAGLIEDVGLNWSKVRFCFGGRGKQKRRPTGHLDRS